jgi:hypothetical protein
MNKFMHSNTVYSKHLAQCNVTIKLASAVRYEIMKLLSEHINYKFITCRLRGCTYYLNLALCTQTQIKLLDLDIKKTIVSQTNLTDIQDGKKSSP